MTPATTPLKLLIVDDQPLIRRALAMTLQCEPDIEVVGQAADGQEAIEQAARLHPDVIIMDLQMPHVSGVEACRIITAHNPDVRIVVLTVFDQDELVFDAIMAGAHAYLLKDATEDLILETIRAVHRGESRLSPTIAGKVLELFRRIPPRCFKQPAEAPAGESAARQGSEAPAPQGDQPNAPSIDPSALAAETPWLPPYEEPLTDKEQRILNLIAQGISNREIAQTVHLAEGTVKNYVSRIMAKLHARSRVELAIRATARAQQKRN